MNLSPIANEITACLKGLMISSPPMEPITEPANGIIELTLKIDQIEMSLPEFVKLYTKLEGIYHKALKESLGDITRP